MGESLFIEPMKRWFHRKRSTTTIGTKRSAEKDQLAGLPRDIFDPRASTKGEVVHDSATLQAVAKEVTDTHELDLDLTQNVFGGRPAAKGNALAEEADPLRAEGSLLSEVSNEDPSEEGETEQLTTVGQKERAALHHLETLRGVRSGPVEGQAHPHLDLKDVFRKKRSTKPQIKALLKLHGTVDARELSDELHDFIEG